jgi:hypothetical protein
MRMVAPDSSWTVASAGKHLESPPEDEVVVSAAVVVEVAEVAEPAVAASHFVADLPTVSPFSPGWLRPVVRKPFGEVFEVVQRQPSDGVWEGGEKGQKNCGIC